VGTKTYDFEDVDGSTKLTNTADLEASGLLKLAGRIAVDHSRSDRADRDRDRSIDS
jgi:hypothetical protein